MGLLIGFRHWMRKLCLAMGAIGAILVLLMMFLVTTDVTGRAAINRPIFGTNELVEYAMVIAVCSAFGVAQTNRFHVRIDVVVGRMPERARAALESLVMLMALAYVGAIAWFGWSQAMTMMARNATSQLLTITRWPFHVWLVVGWSVFFLAILADFLLAVARTLGKDGEPETVIGHQPSIDRHAT